MVVGGTELVSGPVPLGPIDELGQLQGEHERQIEYPDGQPFVQQPALSPVSRLSVIISIL